MTTSTESQRKTAQEWLLDAGRALALLVVLYLIGGGLVWVLPHTLIFLTVVALLWYFYRNAESRQFSLRTLFAVTSGIALIAAIAAFVPAPMLGGSGGIHPTQVTIEVVDEESKAPVGNAEVVLVSQVGKETTTQRSATNEQGIATFTCRCVGGTTYSILRKWRTYDTDGWVLQAKAPGFRAANDVLSDFVVEGESGPIIFRISLKRKK